MGDRWKSTDGVETLILDVDDLARVLDDVGLDRFYDELIDELRSEIRAVDPARVEDMIRAGFNYATPEHGLVEWMPTMVVGDVVSVKTVGYHPENPTRRGLPSVLATTALYDTTTGALVGLSEATLLTALRTGAASAVVTDAIVAPKPIVLGVVGCGAQAVTQIHAISRVRRIERLIVTDVIEDNARSLGERLPEGIPTPEVVGRERFDRLVGELDVLCTCTSVDIGAEPVVSLEHARSTLHVNAVGADFPGKTELDLGDLRRSVVIPDVADQCMIEGESQRLDRVELGPSMAEVLAGDGLDLGRTLTVFDSTGWSFEDLLAARLFHAHARRLGLGQRVALQRTPADPYDPYESLRASAALRSSDDSAWVSRPA